MSLVVEDGSGLANAESYCTVAEATAYHTSRGNGDAWGNVNDQEAALRLASDYMVQCYRGMWKGIRWSNKQALDWPRNAVEVEDSSYGYGQYPAYVPLNTVPQQVKNACAEYALKTANGQLLQDLGRMTESERVGQVAVVYAKNASRQTHYAAAHAWVRIFLKGGGGSYFEVGRT